MNHNSVWEKLEGTLTTKVATFQGIAGLSLKELKTGKSISINGDSIFPTASTIKIHILTKLLSLGSEGKIDLLKRIKFTPDMYGGGSGVIHYLEHVPELTIMDTAILMMLISDNTATNKCIDLVGMKEINSFIQCMGLLQTKLRRKMMDAQAINRGEENVSTPNELVQIMEQLHQGMPTPTVAEKVLRIMKKPKSAYLNKAVGENIPVANKPGGMDKVRCDTGIVYLPTNPYAVSIMTTFSLVDSIDQESFVVDIASTINEFMTIIGETNEFGLGLPRNQSRG